MNQHNQQRSFPFNNQPPPPYNNNTNNSIRQQPNASHPFAPTSAPPPYQPSTTHHAPHTHQAPHSHHGYSLDPHIPPGVSPEIWHWFRTVDEDGDGRITGGELERSLLNADWSTFNSETCRLMVGMFDQDHNGTIDIQEFSALWSYIKQWKECFDSFDTDRSGSIDPQELDRAFKTFGYNLSSNFCNLCIRLFDRKDNNCVTLDDFIQICVMLRVLTAKFQEKDTQKTGVIRVYYEDFMKMALDNTIV